jgi:His/Glu/Gln/Arg/opine family amino acid ABC transporter permease subunit
LLAYYLVHNTLANLERQSIATGFGFIDREAGFEIGEALIRYNAADSYGKALTVGFLNTLIVSFIGIVLTILLGTILGIARLSSNWLMARLSAIYIEVFQNIPILLQLFFWYAFFYELLPGPRPPGLPPRRYRLPRRHCAHFFHQEVGNQAPGGQRSVLSGIAGGNSTPDRSAAACLVAGGRPHGDERTQAHRL